MYHAIFMRRLAVEDVTFSEEELQRVSEEIERLDGDEEIAGINERWGFMTRATRPLSVPKRCLLGLLLGA